MECNFLCIYIFFLLKSECIYIFQLHGVVYDLNEPFHYCYAKRKLKLTFWEQKGILKVLCCHWKSAALQNFESVRYLEVC